MTMKSLWPMARRLAVSNPTITTHDLKAVLRPIMLDNLKNQMLVSGMLRMCRYSGEYDESDLAGLALEIEAMLDVLNDRLAELASHLSLMSVEGWNDADA